jgi:hypothetical protein
MAPQQGGAGDQAEDLAEGSAGQAGPVARAAVPKKRWSDERVVHGSDLCCPV